MLSNDPNSECLKLEWDKPAGNISRYKVIRYNENTFNVVESAYWVSITVTKINKQSN